MFSADLGAVPAADAVYIEDVFSTWLYSGNDEPQTINNGIDLAGKGGLVWVKARNAANKHVFVDTARGVLKTLSSNSSNEQQTEADTVTAFGSNFFSIGPSSVTGQSTINYASWTFREQPRFFDIVTYTGNGVNGRQIAHSLGSEPGAIIFKATSISDHWPVYHRSTGTSGFYLNGPNSAGVTTVSASHTSTTFTVTDGTDQNMAGSTYVAYLFAHNAGGFGATGADNVISCGLTTANGSGDFSVNLGYEPQWVLMKSTSSGIWSIIDNMRGMPASSGFTSSRRLRPQSSTTEDQLDSPYGIFIDATGFTGNLATFSNNFIYIAIRRGPMRTPTSGTSVFQPLATTITSGVRTSTVLPYVDGVISKQRNDGTAWNIEQARLTGTGYLRTESTDAEAQAVGTIAWDAQNAVGILPYSSGQPYAAWLFRRAPGFFDVVCYTGNGVNGRELFHNLSAAPELAICMARGDYPQDYNYVYHVGLGINTTLGLNSASYRGTTLGMFSSSPSSTSVNLRNVAGDGNSINAVTIRYVMYFFASCPGVSKVGSYTGTGNTQTINCGFAAGARFVLIKRTDAAGDWYVWDTARGIVAANDPYLMLNSTAAEVTNTDWVDPAASGFALSNAGGNAVNISGAQYLYFAIS